MKTIPVPKDNRKIYDAMAEDLQRLPEGQAVPFAGTEEERANLYRRMLKRGLAINTAKISDGNFAVWIADSKS
jgi:hypothetical protein